MMYQNTTGGSIKTNTITISDVTTHTTPLGPHTCTFNCVLEAVGFDQLMRQHQHQQRDEEREEVDEEEPLDEAEVGDDRRAEVAVDRLEGAAPQLDAAKQRPHAGARPLQTLCVRQQVVSSHKQAIRSFSCC